MQNIVIETQNLEETQKAAKILAEEIINPHTTTSIKKDTRKAPYSFGVGVKTRTDSATVLALAGNLGAGKTSFTQGFARSLGIKEKISSPTFVLLKIYKLPANQRRQKLKNFKHLVHIDCYRLDSPRDLAHLGLKNILADKDAIVIIEWADKIRKLIPKNAIWLNFLYGDKPNQRLIKF